MKRLRAWAVTGLLVLSPAVITFWILYALVTWLDALFIDFIPFGLLPEPFVSWQIPGTGLIAAVIVVLSVGLFARNMFGRWVVSKSEEMLDHIPGVKSIYGAIKQILETLASSNSEAFKDVVLIEYPRKGIWAIGFTTGKTKGHVQKVTDEEVMNVFLPTTPNPTSGFLLFLPKKDVIYLDMTVEQGVKMVISAGMVTPTIAEGKVALKEEAKETKTVAVEEKKDETASA